MINSEQWFTALERIMNHYGTEAQKEKAKEELNELIEAIDEGNKRHIAEEICDVVIMLYQLQQIYGLEASTIRKGINYKVSRTCFRMELEDGENEQ